MTNIAGERKFLTDQGLHYETRGEWDAVQSYTSDREVFTPVEGFVLHISVTIDHGNLTGHEHADMRTIERIGQERFGIGFPYNAAVFDTGRLYEGQPLSRRGAHTVDDKNKGYKSTGSSRSMNFWWRAIVLPQMVTDDVTDAQVHQAAKWAAAQVRAGYAKRNFTWIGHRDVAFKDCPGNAGYARLPEIRHLTEHYVRNGLGDDELDATERKWLSNIEKRSAGLFKALRGDEDADAQLVAGIRNHIRQVIDEESDPVTGRGRPFRQALGDKARDGALGALEEYGVAQADPEA